MLDFDVQITYDPQSRPAVCDPEQDSLCFVNQWLNLKILCQSCVVGSKREMF